MIRSRLYWEIVLPYAAFVLAVGAGSIAVGGACYGKVVRDGIADRLTDLAQTVAARHEVFLESETAWRKELDRLASASQTRLTVLTGSGVPLADTAVEPVLLDRLSDQPEIREARRTGVGQATSPDGDRLAVSVAVRLTDGRVPGQSAIDVPPGSLLGFVRVEGSTSAVAQAVSRWRRWAATFAGVAGGLGLLWAGVVAFRLAAPIEAIVEASPVPVATERSPLRSVVGQALNPVSSVLAAMTGELTTRLDRLRDENADLSTTAERLSAVLTGMAEGVLAVDRDERILFANSAVAALLDLPSTSLAGRPVWEAVRVTAVGQAVRAALAGQAPPLSEIELPRTQTTLALRTGWLPGEPCPGVVIVLHDVTELRRLENLRREFVSNVSHELKTPLASIQAYAETLLDGAIDDHEHNRQFLQRIAEQTDRLHNLILDMLRLARIEAATDVFEIQKLSADKFIDACVDEHAAIARSREITLRTEPPSQPTGVRADPDGLRSILDNLLDNAINYTPAGGRVTVRWGRADTDVLIEIADTGIGIPAENLPRIFERFHRVDKARSREHGGTGLGLAIVKHLVQVFAGRVEVDSEPGRGSTFRVYLPAE